MCRSIVLVIVGKGEGRAVLSRLFSRGRAFPWKIRSPGKVSKNSEVRENVMRHFRKTLLYPRPDRPANENTTAAPQPDPPQHVEIPCAGGQGGRHKKYPPSSSDHGRPRFDFDDQNHQEDDPLQGRESPQGDRQEVPRLQGQRERLHRRRRGEEGESHFIHIRMPTPSCVTWPSRADPAHRPARRREPLPRSRREEPSTARRPSER